MCYIMKLILSDMETTVAWKRATRKWIQVRWRSWMRLCATRRKAVGSITYITVAQLNEALRYKMEGVGSITYITVPQLNEALRYKTEGRGFDYLH